VSKLDHMLEPEVHNVRRLEIITGTGRRRRFPDDYTAGRCGSIRRKRLPIPAALLICPRQFSLCKIIKTPSVSSGSCSFDLRQPRLHASPVKPVIHANFDDMDLLIDISMGGDGRRAPNSADCDGKGFACRPEVHKVVFNFS
jgi:hypothetical protein